MTYKKAPLSFESYQMYSHLARTVSIQTSLNVLLKLREPLLNKSALITLTGLPNEILLLILSFTPTSGLLKMRGVSSHFYALADKTLTNRLVPDLVRLTAVAEQAKELYADIKAENAPLLSHFRTFLMSDHANLVTEAAWYTSPPAELQTVCELLVMLHGAHMSTSSSSTSLASVQSSFSDLSIRGSNSTLIESDEMSWSDIKRTMTKYEFKKWFKNIDTTVESISLANVKRVEHIIRHDQAITYERLRDVSSVGYSLLIIVAAALQYVNINEKLRVQKMLMANHQFVLHQQSKFVSAVRHL